jgi:hypothetical protein
MFACLILGDSTAVGTAQAVNAVYARQCDVQALEGVSTAQIMRWQRPTKDYATCVFSMGSNDMANESLADRLAQVRRGFCRRRVIWLLPYGRGQAGAVQTIAVRFGDEMLDLARFRSADRIHPARYADVAAQLLR